jgi:hypothetical protein
MLEHTRRTFAAEILEIETAVAKIARALTRLRMGFEQLSDIVCICPLSATADLDDEVA